MRYLGRKWLLAGLFSGAALVAGAANPFVDVDKDSWAYQSVESLANEGLVAGYPDGTFGGERKITRFEMAQMVARLRERQDLNDAQKQQVSKLSSEFSGELENLGVRVSNLEKKTSNTQVILEARFHYMPVYDNLFTGKSHDVYGARVRLNTITKVNDRFTVYGQLQTQMSLGANAYHEQDYYDATDKDYLNDNSQDAKFKVNRLFATYHFGGRSANDRGYGPTQDVVGIGMFPVRMGTTGYTYDGSVKGVSMQIGDTNKGGRFTLAYGNATNINYNYTSPMMKGIDGMADVLMEVNKQITNKEIAKALMKATLGDKYDMATDTYYPMDNVRMSEGEDADVPVAYASYIYKNPQKYEFHVYGMKAVGPVNNIAKAYGFAFAYNVTPKWNLHGEFVKNLVKLPLNAERPHSWNWGISYGTADVLKARSYSFGVDYVYSKAGTYFGGSSSDIADQYMGHVYADWHGKRMPAYVADKIDDLLAGKQGGNYGGAKFYLAKIQYVPRTGLLLEAQYGFGAYDMGGHKMDNMLRLQATIFYK